MTYRKIGDEFEPECEAVGLTDSAYRLHVSMLGWSVNQLRDGKITEADVRRQMPGDYLGSADELVEVGFWTRTPTGWQIVHHLNRQVDAKTLLLRRENDAARQERKRKRDAEIAAAKAAQVSHSLTAGVTEPNRTEPNQGHADSPPVSHAVSHAVTDDPWAKPSEDNA